MLVSKLNGHFYRPQRSRAKVMFLQASVILSTGGVSASVHAGIPHPPEQSPRNRAPLGADTPLEQTPPGKQTPVYGQRAAGTQPTGKHSCDLELLLSLALR